MGALELDRLVGRPSPLLACVSRQLTPARRSCQCLGPVTHSWAATPTQPLSLPIPIFLGQGHLGCPAPRDVPTHTCCFTVLSQGTLFIPNSVPIGATSSTS